VLGEACSLFSVIRSIAVGDIPAHTREVERRLTSLIQDLTTAHLESAAQAMATFANSGRSSEALSAVGHLRDAFNVGKIWINQKKQISNFFGLYTSTESAHKNHEKIEILISLSTIARLIARIYTLLIEENNSKFWIEQNIALLNDLRPDLVHACVLFPGHINYVMDEPEHFRNQLFLDAAKENQGNIEYAHVRLPYKMTIAKLSSNGVKHILNLLNR
jgi:hypothetical protein